MLEKLLTLGYISIRMTTPKPLFNTLLVTAFLISAASITKAQEKGEPPAVKELLTGAFQITRNDLIAKIVSSDSLMVFKSGEDTNGYHNYVGIDNYNSNVQLVGDNNNLRSAKFTFFFTTDHDINKLQYMRMSYFVFTVAGKTGLYWFYGPSEEFSKKTTEPITEHKELELLNADFKYEPKDKAISVNFTNRKNGE
jgi:hypothetical protein